MNGADKDKTNAFEHFIDLYCPSIYTAIARLTGLTPRITPVLEPEKEALKVALLRQLINLLKR